MPEVAVHGGAWNASAGRVTVQRWRTWDDYLRTIAPRLVLADEPDELVPEPALERYHAPYPLITGGRLA